MKLSGLNQIKKENLLFVFLVVIYILYAGFFIFQTSFKVDGIRYFVLFDDEMVSMRYAKNLVSGHGLVWNPGGDKVEGFTNPLWVLYMALFHLLPIAKSKISLCIQVSGVLFLVLNLFYVWKITVKMSENQI